MGVNGTNTISVLKQATGINDNRLSAHHPNGVGSETSFGMFHINGFDATELDDKDVGSPYVGDTFHVWMRPPSGYTQITDVNRGDASVIGPMLANGPTLDVDTDALSTFQSADYDVHIGDGDLGIKLTFEAVDWGNAVVRARWDDAGINSDMPGTEVWIASPEIYIYAEPLNLYSVGLRYGYSGDDLEVLWSFEGGVAPYDITIDRYRSSDNYSWFNEGQQHSITGTSNKSGSWIDTDNKYANYYYKYDITVIGAQNDSDTAQTDSLQI